MRQSRGDCFVKRETEGLCEYRQGIGKERQRGSERERERKRGREGGRDGEMHARAFVPSANTRERTLHTKGVI